MSPAGRADASSVPTNLSVNAVSTIAAHFRVIADPTRIRIMEALDRREATPETLAARLDVPAEVVELHLEVLYQAGVVRLREADATRRYALVDWTDWWFVQQMARALEPA